MKIYYPDGQMLAVLYFFVVGAFLGVIYDVFKLKREAFGKGSVVLFFDDLLFMAITTLVLVVCVFKVNSGRLRWYELAFTGVGFFVYRKTLSKLVMLLFVFVIKKIKWFVSLLLKPVKRSFGMLYAYACFKIKKLCELLFNVRTKRIYIRKCLKILR